MKWRYLFSLVLVALVFSACALPATTAVEQSLNLFNVRLCSGIPQVFISLLIDCLS